ncbi:MAG: hypothetical protein UZ21_OP11001001175 [Microgenomates bacterium OLB22]|nr:MAG: hypothetical protein UZ21_OP11001001175 [Microgenomates bacterium OLB22]
MDENARKLYVTRIPVFTHPLLDDTMVLGDNHFFTALKVGYRQFASGYRAAPETIRKCTAPHWHLITPLQDTPLILYVVDGYLAIEWVSVTSQVIEFLLKLWQVPIREISLREISAPVFNQLSTDELRDILDRMRLAFIASIVSPDNSDH